MSQLLTTYKSIDGQITGVLVGGVLAGDIERDVAEVITYNAVFINDGVRFDILGVVPCNRRFSKARVISARVDDMCTVRVNRQTGKTCLYVFTERDDLYDCNLIPIEVL